VIKVRVGGFTVGKARTMDDAREMAVGHVIGLGMYGQLAPGQPIDVEYRTGGQLIEQSEMLGPIFDDDLVPPDSVLH